MKEKPTMKSTTRKAAATRAKGRLADAPAPEATRDESERRIDEIVERHRETLERLARR